MIEPILPKNIRQILRKAIAAVLAVAFLFSDVAFAADYQNLAPKSRFDMPEFKIKVVDKYQRLREQSLDNYIAKHIASRVKGVSFDEVAQRDIDDIGIVDVTKYFKTRTDRVYVDIDEKRIWQDILIVSVPGIFANRGQFAKEGLWKWNGKPIIWCDENFFYEEGKFKQAKGSIAAKRKKEYEEIISHGKSEIAQWIKKQIELSREGVVPEDSTFFKEVWVKGNPEAKELSFNYHRNSRNLNRLFKKYRNLLDWQELHKAFEESGAIFDSEDMTDVLLAAGPSKPSREDAYQGTLQVQKEFELNAQHHLFPFMLLESVALKAKDAPIRIALKLEIKEGKGYREIPVVGALLLSEGDKLSRDAVVRLTVSAMPGANNILLMKSLESLLDIAYGILVSRDGVGPDKEPFEYRDEINTRVAEVLQNLKDASETTAFTYEADKGNPEAGRGVGGEIKPLAPKNRVGGFSLPEGMTDNRAPLDLLFYGPDLEDMFFRSGRRRYPLASRLDLDQMSDIKRQGQEGGMPSEPETAVSSGQGKIVRIAANAQYFIDAHITEYDDAELSVLCEGFSIEFARRCRRENINTEVVYIKNHVFVYIPDEKLIVDLLPNNGTIDIKMYARKNGLSMVILPVDSEDAKALYAGFRSLARSDPEFNERQQRAIELADAIEAYDKLPEPEEILPVPAGEIKMSTYELGEGAAETSRGVGGEIKPPAPKNRVGGFDLPKGMTADLSPLQSVLNGPDMEVPFEKSSPGRRSLSSGRRAADQPGDVIRIEPSQGILSEEIEGRWQGLASVEEELRVLFIDILKPFKNSVIALQGARSAITSRQEEIYSIISRMNDIRSEIILLENKEMSVAAYLSYRHNYPSSGLCFRIRKVLSYAAESVGIACAPLGFSVDGDEVHGYVQIHGDGENIDIDLAAGQFLPDYTRHPLILTDNEYADLMKPVINNTFSWEMATKRKKEEDAFKPEFIALRNKLLQRISAPVQSEAVEEYAIDLKEPLDFAGTSIEQRHYEERPSGLIHSLVNIVINGKKYKVGAGYYLIITFANGKKVYWGGEHNLSYAFLFEHFGEEVQAIIDKGGIPWRHLDAHRDFGSYKGSEFNPKTQIDVKKEIGFGVSGLTQNNYLGYLVTTGIARNLDAVHGMEPPVSNNPETKSIAIPEKEYGLVQLAATNIDGGITDIDIDIVVGTDPDMAAAEAETRFVAMKPYIVSIAERSDACFFINSSEVGRRYRGAPAHIDPLLAAKFNGKLICELASKILSRISPGKIRDGSVAQPRSVPAPNPDPYPSAEATTNAAGGVSQSGASPESTDAFAALKNAFKTWEELVRHCHEFRKYLLKIDNRTDAMFHPADNCFQNAYSGYEIALRKFSEGKTSEGKYYFIATMSDIKAIRKQYGRFFDVNNLAELKKWARDYILRYGAEKPDKTLNTARLIDSGFIQRPEVQQRVQDFYRTFGQLMDELMSIVRQGTSPSKEVLADADKKKRYSPEEKIILIDEVMEEIENEIKAETGDKYFDADGAIQYGGTRPYDAVAAVEDMAQKGLMKKDKKFADIGAGIGRVVAAAVALTEVGEAIAIEKDEYLCNKGRKAIYRLSELGVIDEKRITWVQKDWRSASDILKEVDAAYLLPSLGMSGEWEVSGDTIRSYMRTDAYLCDRGWVQSGWGTMHVSETATVPVAEASSSDVDGAPILSDPAELLMAIRDDLEWGGRLSEVSREGGVMLFDQERSFCETLETMGVLERVPGNENYRLTEMMRGPKNDRGYLEEMLNRVCDVRHLSGVKTGEPILNSMDIDNTRIAVELIKMTVLNKIDRDIKPAIPENKMVWRLIENEIVPIAQQSTFITKLNKASAASDSVEKIHILNGKETVAEAMAAIRSECPNAIFDVAVSDASHIKNVLESDTAARVLVVNGKIVDFAQIEGVVAALRALRISDRSTAVATLLRIYSILNGRAYNGQIDPSLLDDPVKFARQFTLDLPPTRQIPAGEISKMNERLIAFIISA